MYLIIRRTPEPFRSIDAIIALRQRGGVPLAKAKEAIERAIERRGDVKLVVSSDAVVAALRELGVDCEVTIGPE